MFRIAACLIIILTLAACGKDDQPAAEGDGTSSTVPERQQQQTERTAAEVQPEAQSASSECGKGGTECPAGLECLTWRGGEQVADEIEGAICNDPEAAASGDLSSYTFKVRMVESRSDMYGPDRMGGTINVFEPR